MDIYPVHLLIQDGLAVLVIQFHLAHLDVLVVQEVHEHLDFLICPDFQEVPHCRVVQVDPVVPLAPDLQLEVVYL